MKRGNLQIYWNYMRNNFIKNLTDYRIFLTTDTQDIVSEAIKEFGNEFIVTNDGPNNHLDLFSKLELNDEKLINLQQNNYYHLALNIINI
jgi:hypothetical protein